MIPEKIYKALIQIRSLFMVKSSRPPRKHRDLVEGWPSG